MTTRWNPKKPDVIQKTHFFSVSATDSLSVFVEHLRQADDS